MPERKTVGQLMEEMRLKAGAQNYHGHEYMDLERFAEDTRHMIIFDVLTDDSPVGWKGERTRLFLTEAGYQKSLENQEKGHIGNMDTSIFLGGKEPTTIKELAAVLGKETIDTYNTGESRGRETSHSLNYQKLGKDMPYLFVKSSVALNLS